ncbi:hypothetical protein CPB84DRAFT_1752296 [Gymnopilus junonius]|uniref:Uncharacterized protein n=1 Tax=Gymnopilus junonius TaxID=109634 RepID=A0A9P5NBX8_GYMJU|nr:hypothetical protein CPB84DRAFT_1752296 [Gymnopilus junonius]
MDLQWVYERSNNMQGDEDTEGTHKWFEGASPPPLTPVYQASLLAAYSAPISSPPKHSVTQNQMSSFMYSEYIRKVFATSICQCAHHVALFDSIDQQKWQRGTKWDVNEVVESCEHVVQGVCEVAEGDVVGFTFTQGMLDTNTVFCLIFASSGT